MPISLSSFSPCEVFPVLEELSAAASPGLWVPQRRGWYPSASACALGTQGGASHTVGIRRSIPCLWLGPGEWPRQRSLSQDSQRLVRNHKGPVQPGEAATSIQGQTALSSNPTPATKSWGSLSQPLSLSQPQSPPQTGFRFHKKHSNLVLVTLNGMDTGASLFIFIFWYISSFIEMFFYYSH